jgi:FixJ family two-component response regulator
VVDDDAPMRASLARLLGAAGLCVETYPSADAFLAIVSDAPGCIVLDLRMPGLSGVELQEVLAARDMTLPVVFLTGQGDIPTTVRAMRSGAVDFLTKPVAADVLLAAVRRALEQDEVRRARRAKTRALRAKYESLTPAERRVFAMVVTGRLNKQVAYELGCAERTVKAHRSRAMQKLGADSLADLVRMADELGIAAPPPPGP